MAAATVASNLSADTSTTTTTTSLHSPSAPSPATSTTSSLRSHDGVLVSPQAPAAAYDRQAGGATTPSKGNSPPGSVSARPQLPSRKSTMASRLTRMFSHRDTGVAPAAPKPDAGLAVSASGDVSGAAGAFDQTSAQNQHAAPDGSAAARPASLDVLPAGTTGQSKSSSAASSIVAPSSRVTRQASRDGSADKSATDRTGSVAAPSSTVTATAANGAVSSVAPKRFTLVDSQTGDHSHHLKSAKRHEKLSVMLREMMGGGSRRKTAVAAPINNNNNNNNNSNSTPAITNGNNNAPTDDAQPLSLVDNWVDQMRKEKDQLAMDGKNGPSQTLSLVQKYGKCQEVVGRGAFGIVRVAHKPDSTDPQRELLYAVKEFRRKPEESAKKYQKRLTSEFCISSSMKHANVIKTLDLLRDGKGDFCEVMEFCAGGDLYTLILTAGQLEPIEANCFFKQLMRGVDYLHDTGVAHRDLKPENLLLTEHGALKITDFGNGECFRMAWEKEAHMTAGLCGSAPYIAPEEYTQQEFDARPVDVWACGVIYMAMRSGRHLWKIAQKSEDEFYDRYLRDRREESGYAPIESLRKSSCRNVIYSILDPHPSRRLTASEVLRSEWVKKINVCRAGDDGF